MTEPHYFVFSRDFDGQDRICGDCRSTYDRGDHILIDKLKPYTKYVCPESSGRTGGLGHSGTWTGAYTPVQRTLRDHLCICGLELVEEDNEQWRLTWEMVTPPSDDWHPVTVVRSKHTALSQQAGLLELIDQGEPIRNVVLEQVAP